MIVAKKQVDPQIQFLNQSNYELFTIETMKDINDNDVSIYKSLGFFNVNQLENQKAQLNKQIEDIDGKLEAINNLK